MKIVIDISEELYKNVIEHAKMGYVGSDVWIAVANGTPLPKGHGDLIDRNFFADKYAGCGSVYCEDISCNECNSRIVNKLDVDNAPAVIPADNSEVDL